MLWVKAYQWMSGVLIGATDLAPGDQAVMSYNKVLGKIRLRQLRVEPNKCEVPQNLRKMGGVHGNITMSV